MKSRRRLALTAITAIAILTVAIAVVPHSRSRAEEPPRPAVPVHLNDSLSNDICTIPGLDSTVTAFLKRWEIKGASLSIMRNDSLLYSKGYGWADKEAGVRMEPGNILRMASVSKLITATGIMVLKERGLISLQDTVFGSRGILSDPAFTKAIKDRRMFRITVEQLLRHKGGFTTGHGDPMFSTKDIIRQFRLDTVPDSRTLVCCELSRWLAFTPGTSQRYSNFGYLLLSLIIEEISGSSYEDFIRENVLKPAGCFDMHLARNYYENRYSNEVKYYMQSGAKQVEEFNLSGKMVERCYGGSNIEGLLGAGGWCGSSAELCRFVASIDGKSGVKDIISPESVRQMTEYFDPDTYSLGWNDTKPDGEWTRTGTLAGSTALVKCYPDGECWIMITNTGTYRGPYFSKYTSTLFRNCRQNYSKELPCTNLFGS